MSHSWKDIEITLLLRIMNKGVSNLIALIYYHHQQHCNLFKNNDLKTKIQGIVLSN